MLLLVCCVLVFLGQVIGEDVSLCDHMYTYVERNGHTMGRISLPDPGGDLRLTVTIRGQLKASSKLLYGGLQLEKDATGTGRMLNYYLKFPVNNPMPKISQMTFNGKIICRTQVSKFETTITSEYSHSMIANKPATTRPSVHQFRPPATTSPSTSQRPPATGGVVPYIGDSSDTMESDSDFPRPSQQGHISSRKTTTLQPPSMMLPSAPSMMPPASTKPPAVERQYTDNCGMSVKPQNLMLGGREVEKGDWPWIATVYNDATREVRCNGVLITKRFVVVAAHCVVEPNQPEKTKEDPLTVIMGKFDFSQWAERDLQPRLVQKVIKHPDFDVKTRNNDIALLYLDDNVAFTMYVRPVCLWQDDIMIPRESQMATVVGWNLEENLPRLALVPIVSSNKCSEFTGQVSENTFCAGNRTVSKHCIGDGEGGLVLPVEGKDGNIRWFLRGIASSHLQDEPAMCARGEYVVYTDVARYTAWIRHVVKTTKPFDE